MIPAIRTICAVMCTSFAVGACGSGSHNDIAQQPPIVQLKPQEIIYLRLLNTGGRPLIADTERQEKILTWLAQYTDARITESTLPYIALGVIRKINLSTDVQWSGKGSMLDYFLDNPESIVWNTCAYNVDVFHDVLSEFGIPVRPLHNIKYENQTHATAEFYARSEQSWVYVDVNYGSMFFDKNWRPASFAELLVNDYAALRFYGPFSLDPISSPIEAYEQRDKRNYSYIVENYLPLTAIRYEDQLYKDKPILNPEPVEYPRTHKGRWLVIDSSQGALRYGDAFWRWFEQKYDIDFNGQYSYDIVSIGSNVQFVNLNDALNISIANGITVFHGMEAIVDINLHATTLEMNAKYDGTQSDDFFTGSALADEIRGFDGNDTLMGNSGPDRIYGGNGNDLLYGENGFDSLDGGSGNDELWGGPGVDVFSFGSDWGIDIVYDFEVGEKLDFSSSGLIFQDLLIDSNNIEDEFGNRLTVYGVLEIAESDFIF